LTTAYRCIRFQENEEKKSGKFHLDAEEESAMLLSIPGGAMAADAESLVQ